MKRISGLLLILLLSFCGGSDVSINESSISPSSTTTTTVAGSTTSSSTTTTTVAGSTTSSSTTTTLLFQPIITLKNCPNTVTADQEISVDYDISAPGSDVKEISTFWTWADEKSEIINFSTIESLSLPQKGMIEEYSSLSTPIGGNTNWKTSLSISVINKQGQISNETCEVSVLVGSEIDKSDDVSTDLVGFTTLNLVDFNTLFYSDFLDLKWTTGEDVTITWSYVTDQIIIPKYQEEDEVINTYPPDELSISLFREAFNLWDEAIETISFIETNDGNNADIVIGLVSDLPSNVNGYWNSIWLIEDNNKIVTKSTIRLRRQDEGSEWFLTTVLHEIGNVLGLGDIRVSRDFKSIQEDPLPEVFSGTSLWPFDVRIIKQLYDY